MQHAVLRAEKAQEKRVQPGSVQVDRENIGRTGLHRDPERVVVFGPFHLILTRRLLLKDNVPVCLGSRAFDILTILVERAGELVTKDELMARVWPDTFVEPANLTVHIAALRRALGDLRSDSRYVINIPGRGYRFVFPVEVSPCIELPVRDAVQRGGPGNLPALLTPLIGRAETVGQLCRSLSQHRLVTLVGPGGVGKTATTLDVAQGLSAEYRHGAWLVDLAGIQATSLTKAVASALGIDGGADGDPSRLLSVLKPMDILLVIDNCEHLVAAAAEVLERILQHARSVRVLATSREPLRIQGEHVHRLSPLQGPEHLRGVTARDAARSSAVCLFVERADAALGQFRLTEAEAPVVAAICERLDGLPLAIELAAARAACYGISGIAAKVDNCLALLTAGRRTAGARHGSMRASLDWSYQLLSPSEQAALRRLAVFPQDFSFHAAEALVLDGCSVQTTDVVSDLITKSLVSADLSGIRPRLRLLHTTRAYAMEKLEESGELEVVMRRYAAWLELAPKETGST